MTETTAPGGRVNTVLGSVPAADLGVVAVHEALLSVVPGAEHAPDITIDRSEVVGTLVAKLAAFKAAGGGTIVDATGMFHGRNLPLLEAVSRATGVHVVASTGMGPEENLGGYFKTPQTNPPTPWPADRFADLFGKEVTEGMVVPRIERRAAAGLVTTAVTASGRTGTDESLLRGAARTANRTGVAMSFRAGNDLAGDLAIVLSEVEASRVLVADLDRADAVGSAEHVAAAGAWLGLTNVGTEGEGHLSDAARAALVTELVAAGHADRVLLSAGAIGIAKGQPGRETPYEHVLTTFVLQLRQAGVPDEAIDRILRDNPRALLTVKEA